MKLIALICVFLPLSLISAELHHEVKKWGKESELPRDHHDRPHHHDRSDHHEKHHSSSRSTERHHDRSNSAERHKKSGRECSVHSSYWVESIKEERFCRDTANSNVESCGNCCVAAHLEENNYADTSGVLGFIASDPQNNSHTQCVCCAPKKRRSHSKTRECRPNMASLTIPEMIEWLAIYDNTSLAAEFAGKGKVGFLETSEGFIVTCQCKKGKGNNCNLEFDNDFDTWLSNNSTWIYNIINADGTYNLLTTTLVTCDKNGVNVVDYIPSTTYACFAFTFSNLTAAIPAAAANSLVG
jgi:hypothetical protein